MGQRQPEQVYLLVMEQTIEESLLNTLSAKKDLALAALDIDSDVDEFSLVSGAEELRNRLEILLGAKPAAPVDEGLRAELATKDGRRLLQPTGPASHRERVAAAGGELLGAVFTFLGELIAQDANTAPPPPDAVATLKQRLAECVEEDASGQQRLSVTLPNRAAIDNLATTLARLLVAPTSR